ARRDPPGLSHEPGPRRDPDRRRRGPRAYEAARLAPGVPPGRGDRGLGVAGLLGLRGQAVRTYGLTPGTNLYKLTHSSKTRADGHCVSVDREIGANVLSLGIPGSARAGAGRARGRARACRLRR